MRRTDMYLLPLYCNTGSRVQKPPPQLNIRTVISYSDDIAIS